MILHVRDADTDRLARELAEKRGISITEAVREALEEALVTDATRSSLWERTADLRARISAFPLTGLKADKAFYDSLSEPEDSNSR